jgi:DNA-binding transcriptional LysR family regulator
MNETRLQRIDLNLLWVFHAIFRHRKLTAAATQLSMTQSAVSHALSRLRQLFDDELFIRTGHGVEPTLRSVALAPAIERIIDAAVSVIAAQRDFNPETDEITLRIAMLDYEATLIAPRLIGEVRRLAPRVTLICRHAWRKSAFEMLQEGEADLAIGSLGVTMPGDIQAQLLLQEDWAVIARRDHPFLKHELGRDAYLAADHLLVSFVGGTYGKVDRALKLSGGKRKVVASVPSFIPAMFAVAASDAIATLPCRLVLAHADRFGLQHFPPPIEIEPFPVSLAWHKRFAAAPSRQWLTDLLLQIYAE